MSSVVDEDADLTADALRGECVRGLNRVKVLMAYMCCVSVAIFPVVCVIEWILMDARKGNPEDWWYCLVRQDPLSHWIDSNQQYALPQVLAGILVQSCLLAWASIITYQRACIRMDWIASCVVQNAFTLCLMLLPPGLTGVPTPKAITASVVTMTDFASNYHCDHKANQFVRMCVVLLYLLVLPNFLCLCFAVRAEGFRRRAIAAEKKLRLQTLKEQGLAHKLCCTDGLPRTVVLGGVMFVAYFLNCLTRGLIGIYAQHSFDDFTKERNIGPVQLSGDHILEAPAPTTSLGAVLQNLAYVQLIRGYTGDDLASYRLCGLLSGGALYVSMPSFIVLIKSTTMHSLWGDLDECVDFVSAGDASSVYGFPSVSVARAQCKLRFVNEYATLVMVAFVFFTAVSALRTFALNDLRFDDFVTPAPNDKRNLHLLDTADSMGFENDLNPPPQIFDTTPRGHRPLRRSNTTYSAVIIRPIPNNANKKKLNRSATFAPGSSSASERRATFQRANTTAFIKTHDDDDDDDVNSESDVPAASQHHPRVRFRASSAESSDWL